MSAMFALCQIRGHRALCGSVGTVIKCRNKAGRSCTEDSPVETIRRDRGESWQGPVCLWGREMLSHSCWCLFSSVSSSLFYLRFQSSCSSLFSVFLPFFLILRHYLNLCFSFTTRVSSIFFPLVSTKQHLLNNLGSLLNVSPWSSITVSP